MKATMLSQGANQRRYEFEMVLDQLSPYTLNMTKGYNAVNGVYWNRMVHYD